MPARLASHDGDFEHRLEALLSTRREAAEDVDRAVEAILRQVQRDGDAALIALTERFDRVRLEPSALRVGEAEIDQALEACAPVLLQALVTARDRIRAHHERQLPRDERYRDALGVELGWRWTPLDAVGLYVPGGTASYPSSVLMNAVPAKLAGVRRVAMAVPAPEGRLNPLVLAAARLAGVEEVYRVGGAQAIAALAFGTATIPPVDKIVGPGNAYVAAAKRQVFGRVGIDMVAGPSEVLVVADADNDPDWIAADLLAQAEHDSAAQAVLITDSEPFAAAVEAAVERALAALPRALIAAASWRDHGAIIVVGDLSEAPMIVDRFAPEHLELAVADPEALLGMIRHAGSVFLGRHTPEAMGDYVAGPNHVLPTARSARFSSGLSALDFMKRMSVLRLGPDQLRDLGGAAIALAEAEGLAGHARSIAVRLTA